LTTEQDGENSMPKVTHPTKQIFLFHDVIKIPQSILIDTKNALITMLGLTKKEMFYFDHSNNLVYA
jgi:hypothetical protein